MQIRCKIIYFSCLLLVGKIGVSCTEKPLTEADVSAFGPYVERLDTSLLEQSYQNLFKADTSSWLADRSVKKRYLQKAPLVEAPVWFDRMGLSDDADSILAILYREVKANGLDTAAFSIPQLQKDFELVHSLAFDSLGQEINEVLPRIDYLLSKAYVRYTVGQRYGFMRPDRVFNHLDEKPDLDKHLPWKDTASKPKDEPKEYLRLFDYAVKEPDYAEAVGMLSQTEDRLDFLMESSPGDALYHTLRQQYTATTDADERHRLAVNMERCRWQMARPEKDEKHILVNLAAQQLWAVCPDSVLSMKICCGAKNHKTPLLNSKIRYLQTNPDWIVPTNIIKTDFVRHEGDSAYFARNNYYIVDRTTGDTLNPVEVTAQEMLQKNIRVGQRSGEGNSLGRIIFRFDNSFGVYLHDTNNKAAFKRERRTLSHGCVRVEKPFELACFVLADVDDWILDRLRISIDRKPETKRGEKYLEEHQDDPRPFRLLPYQEVDDKVPLYITYYTVYPNPETGKMETWPDLYGYDKAISKSVPFLK